jgi:hypothetical protein
LLETCPTLSEDVKNSNKKYLRCLSGAVSGIFMNVTGNALINQWDLKLYVGWALAIGGIIAIVASLGSAIAFWLDDYPE